MSTEIEQAGDAPEAEQTSSPDVTVPEEGAGSDSSSEAADERSIADKARDDFLETFGEPEDPAPKEQEQETKAEAETSEDAAEREDGQEDDEDGPRIPEEEFKALPDTVRGRIGYLSKQRRELKKANTDLSEQVEAYKPAHESLGQLREYTERNNLSSQDVTNGLSIMAKLQTGDMDGFLKDVMPFVDMAQRATGKAVSPEIQKMVDDGEISQEAALRMSQADQQRILAEQASQRMAQQHQAHQQETQRQQHVNGVLQAVTNAEAELKSSDPDYALKEPAIQAQLKSYLSRGLVPKDANDAVELVREIHKNIVVSTPQPQQPTPPRPGATSAKQRAAAPKSTLEALELASESAPRE